MRVDSDAVEKLFAGPGAAAYLGEAVSVATHMLQAGLLAERSGAHDELIAAALLHDVGHLVAPTSSDVDAQHEVRGANWLTGWFGEGVTEPVRLHVAAKRYLCHASAGYVENLSPASRHSLALQGGVMSATEAEAFAHLAYANDAIAVRRWDEAAKDPHTETPAFEHFLPVLHRVLLRQRGC
jgi:gamma-butyrobetaine dioxygenase